MQLGLNIVKSIGINLLEELKKCSCELELRSLIKILLFWSGLNLSFLKVNLLKVEEALLVVVLSFYFSLSLAAAASGGFLLEGFLIWARINYAGCGSQLVEKERERELEREECLWLVWLVWMVPAKVSFGQGGHCLKLD